MREMGGTSLERIEVGRTTWTMRSSLPDAKDTWPAKNRRGTRSEPRPKSQVSMSMV